MTNTNTTLTLSDMNTACKAGDLAQIKYLHENGCPWDADTCARTIEEGHLDCLKYIYKNGCPVRPHVCEFAKNGCLDCLKYLYENDIL